MQYHDIRVVYIAKMFQVVVIILALFHRIGAQEHITDCSDVDCNLKMLTASDTKGFLNFTVNDICPHLSGYCINRKGYIYVQAGMCISQFNSSINIAIAGLCPYFPDNLSWSQVSLLSNFYLFPARLPLTEIMDFTCELYNREGPLCRKCKSGYGPAVYGFSLMCAECSSSSVAGWALYLLLVLFPITVFYVLVIVFNVSATTPPFTAFVLMCQTYCTIELMYVPLKMKLAGFKSLSILLQTVRVLCGFWNLDFFRYLIPPFCVSSHLSNIQALSLEYIHVVYPLLLVLITFICIELHARNFTPLVLLWKPFHRCVTRFRRSWDPRASIINAFSTFLLLNFSKIIFVAGYCLYSIDLFVIDPNLQTSYHHSVLYSEPKIHLLSKQHLPYLLCSVTLLVVFVFIPTLLLCFYPTKIFRRLLQCSLSLRWQQAVGAFIDTFQGHYKDGTSGTRDYRAASSIHLIVLFLIIFICMSGYLRLFVTDTAQPILVTVSLFYALARPCKQYYANVIQSLLCILTAFIMSIISYSKHHRHYMFMCFLIMFLCLLTPHVVLGVFMIYRAAKWTGINFYRLWSIIRSCRWVCANVGRPELRYGESCLLRNEFSSDECSPLLNET